MAKVYTSWNQYSFKFIKDDGTVGGAPELAALNTNITTYPDSVFRLHIRLYNANTPSVLESFTFKLQYNLNAGGWVDVPAQGSTSDPVRYYNSTDVVDSDPIDGVNFRITSPVYLGAVNESGNTPTVGKIISAGNVEYCFVLELYEPQLNASDVVQFRVVESDGTVLSTYTSTPQITAQYTHQAECALSAAASLDTGETYFSLTSASPSGADYTINFTLSSSAPSALAPHAMGVIARGAAAGNGYIAGYDAQSGKWFIAKLVSGVRTDLQTSAESFPAGGEAICYLDLDGTTLTLYANGSQKVQTTDSTYSSAGAAGFYAHEWVAVSDANGMAMDQWGVMGKPVAGPSAALVSAASVSAAASVTTLHEAAEALTVTASMVAAATNTQQAQAALSSTVTITALAGVFRAASATLAAQASITGAGAYRHDAVALLDNTATLLGSGAYLQQATTTLSAVATLGATPSATRPGAATLDAVATLTASATTGGLLEAIAALSSAATLDASATSSTIHTAASALAVAATLAGSGSVDRLGAAGLSVTATLGAAGVLTLPGALSCSVTASLAADATYLHLSTLQLVTTALLDGQGVLDLSAIAALGTAATVTADATLSGQITGQAALSTTAALSASPSVDRLATGALGSTATVEAKAALTTIASAALPVTATLDATPQAVRAGASLQVVAATLSAAAVVDHNAATATATVVTMDAKPAADWAARATVITNATLLGVEADLVAWDTFSETQQTALSDHTGEYGSWGASSGNLALQIDANGKLRMDL